MPYDYKEILQVVKENLQNINTTSDLAEILNIPQEILKKTFARSSENGLGITIDLLKIEEMKRLLITTDMKCLSICIQVGLREDSGSHFSEGIPALRWRISVRSIVLGGCTESREHR
ncbi:MAG: hypothetical protein V1799_15180 [bacterium]